MSTRAEKWAAESRQREEANAIARGDLFRAVWTWGGVQKGPSYFPTRAVAEVQREKEMAEWAAMFPASNVDVWPARYFIKRVCVQLEQLVEGTWRPVAGSEREVAIGAENDAPATKKRHGRRL